MAGLALRQPLGHFDMLVSKEMDLFDRRRIFPPPGISGYQLHQIRVLFRDKRLGLGDGFPQILVCGKG